MRAKDLSRDWLDDLAIFHAAYPGLNYLNQTYAIFSGLIARARHAKMYVDDRMDQANSLQKQAEFDNRLILVGERFKFITQPVEDESKD